MVFRKSLVTALAVIVLGLAAVASIRANASDHMTYLTFNRPVGLPGVSLGSGTYIFELPDSIGAHKVVRVLSRDRKIVYLTAFTQTVVRPAGLNRNQLISFAEAPANTPQPITVWWSDDSTGQQFVYSKK